MSTPSRYIHIGFPKCASTAMQKSLFARHPELHHLGASSGGTNAQYVNDEVATAIEVGLRYEKEAAYDAPGTIELFEREFAFAAAHGKRAVGISSEGLSMMLSRELDTALKARRLHAIFGDGTKIVFLIREQWSFLKSIYREYVLSGIYYSYDEFVQNVFYNQARGFFLDMNYYDTYALYCRLFGQKNVLMVPYEALRAQPGAVLALIQQHIGVTPLVGELAPANVRASDTHIESIRRLNYVFRLKLSRSTFEPVFGSRNPAYFEKTLKVGPPPQVQIDQKFMQMYSQRRGVDLLPYPVDPVSYDLSAWIFEKADGLFKAWNRTLIEKASLDVAACGYSV